jgi:murein DD-endopeptidase MepM/ murein hydrolase activator NlpD
LVLLFNQCQDSSYKQQSELAPDNNKQPQVEHKKIHGFSSEIYSIDSSIVATGESFGALLQGLGASFSDINSLGENFKSVYDIRRIYPGDKYYSLKEKDSLKLSKFIYQHSPTEIIIMHFQDSVSMELVQKPVVIKLKYSGGKIKSSLWQSFIDNKLTPALVSNVANLYAWTIDFFDIKPEDSYKIIYESKYVDGQFIGVGDIKAIVFNHMGKDLYAFHYASPKDKVKHYYNEEGESMQRALLSAPLEYVRISSKFSHSRLHPIKKIYRPHYGVDYAAPSGTDVVATGDGKVIFAKRSGGAGKMIKIKHTFGNVVTKYLHLLKFAKGVKVGSYVEQGQKIAEVGSTGLSTGPHLDYRVYINGKPQNPLKMNIPSKDPIPESLRSQYLKDIEVLKNSLDKINNN